MCGVSGVQMRKVCRKQFVRATRPNMKNHVPVRQGSKAMLNQTVIDTQECFDTHMLHTVCRVWRQRSTRKPWPHTVSPVPAVSMSHCGRVRIVRMQCTLRST